MTSPSLEIVWLPLLAKYRSGESFNRRPDQLPVRSPFMVCSIDYNGKVCSKPCMSRSPALSVSYVKHDNLFESKSLCPLRCRSKKLQASLRKVGARKDLILSDTSVDSSANECAYSLLNVLHNGMASQFHCVIPLATKSPPATASQRVPARPGVICNLQHRNLTIQVIFMDVVVLIWNGRMGDYLKRSGLQPSLGVHP